MKNEIKQKSIKKLKAQRLSKQQQAKVLGGTTATTTTTTDYVSEDVIII